MEHITKAIFNNDTIRAFNQMDNLDRREAVLAIREFIKHISANPDRINDYDFNSDNKILGLLNDIKERLSVIESTIEIKKIPTLKDKVGAIENQKPNFDIEKDKVEAIENQKPIFDIEVNNDFSFFD